MTINYIAERSYTKTVWFKETLYGIEEKCNLLKYKLNQIDELEITADIKILMIIGTAPSWVSKIADICNNLGIVTLIISCHPINQNANSNYVLINHDDATRQCIDYLKQCDRKSIALYGVNTDSYADMIKNNYFEEKDVYYIGTENKLRICFDKFLLNYKKYDAVICTNYISAVFLISEFKNIGVKIPKDMYVICYGDSVIGRKITPSITTITLDHKLLGLQAVQVYKYIYKNSDKAATTISVPCKIIPAESTEYKDYIKSTVLNTYSDIDDFSNDKDVIIIQKLEQLLREIDKTDLAIIEFMQKKESIPKIADRLYVSDSSIKYRIKKMLEISSFENFEQLLSAYKKYLT